MIKEPVIAMMLGLMLIYEFLVLVNMNSFIQLAYTGIETKTKEQKVKLFLLSMFNFVYFVFIVLGTAFGTQWYMYGILFGISIISGPVLRMFKNKNSFRAITAVKYIDTLVSIYLIVMIFLNHFHS